MPIRPLPERPDLEQLRRQAKDLRNAAREHGFASWPQLKADTETRALDLAQRVNAFLYASVQGPAERAARLLRDDPSIATYDFRTAVAAPLRMAAAAGSVEVVRLLLDRGADLEARDATFDSTPLVWASVGSGLRLGRTPRPDWVATIQLLIDAGASIEDSWIEGEKAPSPEVAQLLRAHGVTGPDDT